MEVDPVTRDSGKGCWANKTNVHYKCQESDLKHVGVHFCGAWGRIPERRILDLIRLKDKILGGGGGEEVYVKKRS